jgi:sugar diacid utilization regulator
MPGMSPPPTAEDAADRVRGLHQEMVQSVMAGGGVRGVAALAAQAAGAPVAIVVPELDDAVAPRDARTEAVLSALRPHVRRELGGRASPLPAGVVGEAPVRTGDERVGGVFLLESGAGEEAPSHAQEILAFAAIATLTELAVAAARDEADAARQGSFIELLRTGTDLTEQDLLRRARRLGTDLGEGAVALCALPASERPRFVRALILDRAPNALAEIVEDRVYALLAPRGDGDPAESALSAARRVAEALDPHALVGFSGHTRDPRNLARAMEEAELMLEVLGQASDARREEIRSATYRLLFQAVTSHPDEVRRLYEGTVGPLVRYDAEYRTELVGTLEAYLAHNCNMNQTAAAIYAHRHTVAYRLERIRELTALDPGSSEERERLSLGLKAFRVLGPRLPR